MEHHGVRKKKGRQHSQKGKKEKGLRRSKDKQHRSSTWWACRGAEGHLPLRKWQACSKEHFNFRVIILNYNKMPKSFICPYNEWVLLRFYLHSYCWIAHVLMYNIIISFTHCQPHQSKQVGLFGNVPQVPTAAVISLQANVWITMSDYWIITKLTVGWSFSLNRNIKSSDLIWSGNNCIFLHWCNSLLCLL